MPLLSSVKPAPGDPARNQAERILALAEMLPGAFQPVFAAWLGRHSGGAVSCVSKSALFRWLLGMVPERALAQYHLVLAEIAWLEMIAENIQKKVA